MESIRAAIDSGAWYTAAGLIITLLVTVWKKVQPAAFELISTKYQWIPAVVLASLAAFATSFAAGEPWYMAVVGLFNAALTAIGAHHTVKRMSPQKEANSQ